MVELEGLEAAPTEDKAAAQLPELSDTRPDGEGGIYSGVGDHFGGATKERPSNWMEGDAPAPPSASTPAAPTPGRSAGPSSKARPRISSAPPATGKNSFAGERISNYGFADAWSSVESFSQRVKPPDPVDWSLGGLEYNVGTILKDRAKYGSIRNPVIVKTPVLSVSTSAKVLRSAGSVLRFAGGATAFMGAVDISARWRSGQIGTGRALLEGTITGAGFFGPIGLGLSIAGSLGVSAYDRYTERGCIICWDGF